MGRDRVPDGLGATPSQRLLARIDAEFLELAPVTGRSAPSPPVRAAMESVPREAFIPPGLRGEAHANRPLPIGHGQTISQPFMVALMTELADVGPDDRVLEVGTGSGYQTAILARLARTVYSLEVVPALSETARSRLAALGIANVEVRTANGGTGWPEAAPFDVVMVTCAAPKLPPALVDQLAVGGRMVIPIGLPRTYQRLHRIVRRPDGSLDDRELLDVAFVPFV